MSEREAIDIASKLFREHRKSADMYMGDINNYDVTVLLEDVRRIVRFFPKERITLGDHPMVFIDCETKKAEFFEGE